MNSSTLRFSALLAVLVTAVLLIAFVLGAIDADQFKSTFGKAIAVIAIIALASIATLAISHKK